MLRSIYRLIYLSFVGVLLALTATLPAQSFESSTQLYSQTQLNQTRLQASTPLNPQPAEAITAVPLTTYEGNPVSYEWVTLPNQLQLLLISDPECTRAVVGLTVLAGSATLKPESLWLPGLAARIKRDTLLSSLNEPAKTSTKPFDYCFYAFQPLHTQFFFTALPEHLPNLTQNFAEAFSAFNFDTHISAKSLESLKRYVGREKLGWELELSKLEEAMIQKTGAPSNLYNQLDSQGEKAFPQALAPFHLAQLNQFYTCYYSANLMRGVIKGYEALPTLRALAFKSFGLIPDRAQPPPENKLAPFLKKEAKGQVYEFQFAKSQAGLLEFIWDLPVHLLQESPVFVYLHWLLTSCQNWTLHSWLLGKHFATDAGIKVFCAPYSATHTKLTLAIPLTELGWTAREQVLDACCDYIQKVIKEGTQSSLIQTFNEWRQAAFKSVLSCEYHSPTFLNTLLLQPQEALNSNSLLGSLQLLGMHQPLLQSALAALSLNQAQIWICYPALSKEKARFLAPARSEESVEQKQPNDYSVSYLGKVSACQKTWAQRRTNWRLRLPKAPDSAIFLGAEGASVKTKEMRTPAQRAPEPSCVEANWIKSRYFSKRDRACMKVRLNLPLLKATPFAEAQAALWRQLLAREVIRHKKASRQELGVYLDILLDHAGLTILSCGSIQRTPAALETLVKLFSQQTITAEQFTLAKEAVLKQAMHVNLSVERRLREWFYALNGLRYLPIMDNATRKALQSLTLKDFLIYREKVFKSGELKLTVVSDLNPIHLRLFSERLAKAAHIDEGQLRVKPSAFKPSLSSQGAQIFRDLYKQSTGSGVALCRDFFLHNKRETINKIVFSNFMIAFLYKEGLSQKGYSLNYFLEKLPGKDSWRFQSSWNISNEKALGGESWQDLINLPKCLLAILALEKPEFDSWFAELKLGWQKNKLKAPQTLWDEARTSFDEIAALLSDKTLCMDALENLKKADLENYIKETLALTPEKKERDFVIEVVGGCCENTPSFSDSEAKASHYTEPFFVDGGKLEGYPNNSRTLTQEEYHIFSAHNLCQQALEDTSHSSYRQLN